MENKLYTFDMFNVDENLSYIFQTVKGRPLSDVYHTHDFYEFIVVIEGNCLQFINGREFYTEKNDLVILCPGDYHKFIKQSADANILALSVKHEEIEAFETLFCLSDTPLKTFNVRLSSKQFHAVSEFYFSTKEFEYKLFLSTVFCIYAELQSLRETVPLPLKNAMDGMRQPENLREGTDRFVELSGYSKTHITRLMKKYLGITPHEYVVGLRLSEAYNAILFTNIHIEELSESLGYESYSHFQQIFRKKFGITPAALRRKQNYRTV